MMTSNRCARLCFAVEQRREAVRFRPQVAGPARAACSSYPLLDRRVGRRYTEARGRASDSHGNPFTPCANVRFGSRFQPVNATHYSLSNQRSVADEAETADPLHGEPEGADMGALAEG